MVQPLGQLNQAGQMLDCAGKGLGAPIVSRNVSGVQLPADSTALGGVEARSSSERATLDKSNTQPRARQPADPRGIEYCRGKEQHEQQDRYSKGQDLSVLAELTLVHRRIPLLP